MISRLGNFIILVLAIVLLSTVSDAQSCNGILISYSSGTGVPLPPNFAEQTKQPYQFESTLTVLNNGYVELKPWKVFVGFQHKEFLASASNAVIADGTNLPTAVGNGTVFVEFSMNYLKTAVETAGDLIQMQAKINLVGTVFGVAPPTILLPSSINLANDGFICLKTTGQGKNGTNVCCTRDPEFKTNITTDEKFLPRQNGDLTIMYDVIRTYDSNYWAEVSITNHNSLGRLDNWRLSWDWMNDEFIFSMKGAYPSVVDASDCIFGKQGTFYKELDFADVLSCKRRPTIIDLPPTKFDDTDIGKIPSCCRNGIILPPSLDPSKSVSRFQMQVFKMPPMLDRTNLSPPQNWKINGSLNPDYKCGPPIRVSPTENPDSGGLPINKTVIASWQVVCNITIAKGTPNKCCVSFSAVYNESVIPCQTCACGCPKNVTEKCNTTAPAMWLPPQALLVPFENRTAQAVAWANLKHLPVPQPMPCSDNCGVNINWHLLADYNKAWWAKVTLFNWGETTFVDWFAAVQMDNATAGFEKMYSFKASAIEIDGVNNTIIMQGLEGLNYLVGATDGADPKIYPRVPGKQQSVIAFTKKSTPGINIVGGDGFPTKVFFNGDECSLPSVLPTRSASTKGFSYGTSMLLPLFVFMW